MNIQTSKGHHMNPMNIHTRSKKLHPMKHLLQISTGCSWDNKNWSCAYDSVLMCLYALYESTSTNYHMEWSIQSTLTSFLTQEFNKLITQKPNDNKPFNELHDKFRCRDFVKVQFFHTMHPSKKLADKFLGPYEVIAQPGTHLVMLWLPDNLHAIHPVFDISMLEPATLNTIPD